MMAALTGLPSQARAEQESDEGDEADAAEEPATDPSAPDVPTRADRKNEHRLSTTLPSHILLAHDQALWRAPAKGGAAKKLGPLPAASGTPTALLADQAGEALALGLDETWWYSPAPNETTALHWVKLPCQQAPALHARGAFCLVDRKSKTWAQLGFTPAARKTAPQIKVIASITLPANAQATQLANGDVVWVGKDAIYQAKGTKLAKPRVLAKEPPLAHFSTAPDGDYALGHYEGRLRKADGKATQPLLYAMRLDGIGSKRRSVHRGLPLAWADDGQWALVQDEQDACIVAVAGGHFRCYPKHQGLDLSPSGEWILMRDATGKLWRGQRSGTKMPPPVAIGAHVAELAIWDHRTAEVAVPSSPSSAAAAQ